MVRRSCRSLSVWALAALVGVPACLGLAPGAAEAADEPLVLYSGRSKSLVQPIVRQFTKETGIPVDARYGGTAQLAVALTEEGERSPADVFWAQDAGALGAVVERDLLAELPSSLLERVPAEFRSPQGRWVATSGRARVLAYSPQRVTPEEMPQSVFDLTDERYRGRVAWAPTNASFQAFVTAMRKVHGDDVARQWLQAMKDNQTKSYPKNTAIIQAIAAGEADFGLPNHYYLHRFKTADSGYPVEQASFSEAGDIGNMVNVAGVGVLASSDRREDALKLVEFLLSPKAQQYFASETFEYPVTDEVIPSDRLTDADELREAAPAVDLDALEDLEGTLAMLRELGLI